MFSYDSNVVMLDLVVDSAHYKKTEEWDKHHNVIELFNFVKENSVNGRIYLTEEQRDVYLCGECNDVRYYDTAVDNY
jgi:hypothetical protein